MQGGHLRPSVARGPKGGKARFAADAVAALYRPLHDAGPSLGDRPMTPETDWCTATGPLPRFPVHLDPPDLRPWLDGNTGIPGVWRFRAAMPGPRIVITALMHGNEIAGAAALDRMLRARPAPRRGTLSLVFANLDAARRFDRHNPTASRFADEDLNRLWEDAVLNGSRASLELSRARALRPVIDTADVLLDLHSMLWPSDPLILCGPSGKGRRFAEAVAVPSLIVADHGHVGGRRLIDYERFVDETNDATAILVEAGQHWEPATVDAMLETIGRVLAVTGLGPPWPLASQPRVAEVTLAVTASSGAFAFAAPYRGGEVIARRDTLIAVDGATEIRTPHDDCLLVMPSLRPSRGHTAVRLARFI
ncbi:MAG TPA: succinylglutamate desuccinylase/aspartoacylase family protein [Acetobacteraceae bacterium]|nr:succinylglutamate desuccinylase/aspartoacylase family protein [Acetobacteraceae bacterium]